MDERRAAAFRGHEKLAEGLLADVVRAIHGDPSGVVVFDAADGTVIDLDLRGDAETAAARVGAPAGAGEKPAPARGRGRPKLGVTAREVTLLPRHWDWLAGQGGGASAALRRLVETARRKDEASGRKGREAAYRVMSALSDGLSDYDEAARALFAADHEGFAARISRWPEDVRGFVLRLAFGETPSDGSAPAAPSRNDPHLSPTQASVRRVMAQPQAHDGPVAMLNLLRFRARADYAAHPDLAPETPVSGAEAFERYLSHARPLLEARGGSLDFIGVGGAALIGPESERWDCMMLVRQPSLVSLLESGSDPQVQAGLGHRQAALEDSRLIPFWER